MANDGAKVLAAVEAALVKNPEATVDELFEVAKKVSPSVGKLSKRRFHATYPLQIKRKKSAGKRKRTRGKQAATRASASRDRASRREAVRRTFLAFASDLAAAESRKDLVKVVAGVDRYVDKVLEAVGR